LQIFVDCGIVTSSWTLKNARLLSSSVQTLTLFFCVTFPFGEGKILMTFLSGGFFLGGFLPNWPFVGTGGVVAENGGVKACGGNRISPLPLRRLAGFVLIDECF